MRCVVVSCPQLHRNADGYCHNHRAEAAAALTTETVHGGDVLTITREHASTEALELGRAGTEALAPYLTENMRLQTLVLKKTKLGADGIRVLSDALRTNATLTALDVSENDLKAGGAKAVGEMLAVSGALTSLDISNNRIGGFCPEGYWNNGNPKGAITATPEGPKAIAAAIPECRALVSANLLNNDIGTEQADNLATILKEHATLRSLCGNEGNETELDMSGKKMGADGAIMLAPEIVANGAMVSANLLDNNIGVEQAQNLATVLKDHATLKSLCGNKGDETELDTSGKKMGADGAIMLAPEIVANGAMVTANILGNKIGKEQLAKLQEIMKAHPTLVSLCGMADVATEANLSGLRMDAADAVILADELPAKGALTALNLANNYLNAKGAKHIAKAIKGHGALTSLNISDNKLARGKLKEGWVNDWETDMTGVFALADAIKNNGALENLHIGDNQIPIENMNEIIDIVEAKPAMKVLCAVPFRDKTITELDVSSQSLGVEGALVIRRYLENNGALTSLNVSSNSLGGYYRSGNIWISDMTGIKALAAAIRECRALETITFGDEQAVTMETNMTEADLSGKELGASGAIIVAAFVPKCQAMTSLNISSNDLRAEDAKHIAAVLPNCQALEAITFGDKQAVTIKADMTKADLSGKQLGASGGIILIAFLPKCQALTSLDVSNNDIPLAQVASIQAQVARSIGALGLAAKGMGAVGGVAARAVSQLTGAQLADESEEGSGSLARASTYERAARQAAGGAARLLGAVLPSNSSSGGSSGSSGGGSTAGR